MDSPLEDVVDRTVATARASHPGRGFGIVLSPRNAQALPVHSDRLAQGGGLIMGHIYRECLVSGVPGFEEVAMDALVIVSPVYERGEYDSIATYYGDLRSGRISTELPPDMQPRRHRR